MKKVMAILVAMALVVGVVACTSLGVLYESMVVYGAESYNSTQVEGNIMAVFYTKADGQVLFWVTDALVTDRGDGRWDIDSPQRIVLGLSQTYAGYQLYQYKPLPLSIGEGVYLDDLGLQAITWSDLPHSEHIGKLTAVDPTLAKPATVTRRYMGVNYDVPCLVTEAIKNAYIDGDLELGDYVLVSFIDENPNGTEKHIAIVTDKVYESW